jgi:cytosine/adenosine deaminase-related metal-dependent hydrolase
MSAIPVYPLGAHFKDYGFAIGRPADVVIFNAQTPEQAVAEIARPVAAFEERPSEHGLELAGAHDAELSSAPD